MRIDNIKIGVLTPEQEVFDIVLKKSKLKRNNVKYYKIIKKSIDARDKNDIKYVYSVDISTTPEIFEEVKVKIPSSKKTILVVGFGPSGMFSALYLARSGFNVIVVERGLQVDKRKRSIEKFSKEGILDTESNVQFGEGGAGTFSDGKLNTGVNSPYISNVLHDFVKYGAPSDIEYLNKPHIGSDNLPKVVENIRKEIERLGGKVLFSHKLTDVVIKNGKAVSAIVNGGEIVFDDIIMAIGHSSRDTFYSLLGKGLEIERKAFAIGMRIEHLKSDIDEAQYGSKFAKSLPSADYRLASHKGDRGVFTFCMCPGGFVMPAASEEGMVASNGMSLYSRDNVNSNSAVLCEIYPDDFYDGVLGGVELQREIERKAYVSGGSNYSMPIQTVGDYYDDIKGKNLGKVKPTIERYAFSNLNDVLPGVVNKSIKIGLQDMANKLRCFGDRDGLLTGVETRSSSPIRILRNELFESINVKNFYPCGEGCGYAGGIMSAAVDGIKVAIKIGEKY